MGLRDSGGHPFLATAGKKTYQYRPSTGPNVRGGARNRKGICSAAGLIRWFRRRDEIAAAWRCAYTEGQREPTTPASKFTGGPEAGRADFGLPYRGAPSAVRAFRFRAAQ